MRSKLFNNYSNIFWVFMVGSFLGFIHENLLTLLKGKYILRQGLIYEPLIPIYGLGAIVFYLIYKRINTQGKNLLINILKVFIIGFLVGGTVEYICSFVQEKIFGTISWDYSYLKYNLNGRTSLLHTTFWGVLGEIFYWGLFPLLKKLSQLQELKYGYIITIIFSLILLFDSTISFLACCRATERKNKQTPSNSFETFLDNHYPNEYLDKIYNNAKTVKK